MESISAEVWPLVIADMRAGLNTWPQLKQDLAEDMMARARMGEQKYGMPLRVDNGRNATVDAYQEALDLCAYTRQRAEQTHDERWHHISGQAVGLAAAIKFIMMTEGR